MNTIKHTEYTHNNRRVILDTCELTPGRYETMLLSANGRETAAEAMTKALSDMGYDALTYCAID